MEKLDAIEAQSVAEIAKVNEAVATQVAAVKEELTQEFAEKVAALEAKVADIKSPSIIKLEKTVTRDVNKRVREALASFVKGNSRHEKELEMFADESEQQAFLQEASALTGSGAGIGGRTAYDPVFVALRLANPLRGVGRNVTTDGSTYQFRAKTGDAGAAWGYPLNNNGSATTESTTIWQLPLQDLNVAFPVRTAALDDIDGLEANLVSDMLVEFSQAEALSMVQNNDQGATSLPYGGSNGLRGLVQYPGANASYTGGTTSTASFGSSGTGSSAGLHSIATYDQLTTNGNTIANNVTYKDVVNFIYALPQQYWTESAKFVISPLMLQAIRGLTDSQGRPIYIDGLSRTDGIVGQLLGFDVVVNKYLDVPSIASTASTNSLYPMFFGDWNRGFAIVDRLNMVLRRYDQTLPGSITFFGEKRLASSIVDPNAIVRYRSTATVTKP
ncbi:COG4653 Predicted phage phi-C31 gp36 major capsid-like protein [uncultured Caudovirales phage]|uniref:COG4653 Predicted phage phi-C31 gp36 major capsid-like protein n=1 Tax=uncultured Caudovirales phage TaxID=2100421 RepID=A0A6J5KLL4_9CAUD|nr:COG4653 Predicted phage phi-C31 gp36 major capsid-like protein [uncultured Caudovirales phage]